jgi:hypothetical protein
MADSYDFLICQSPANILPNARITECKTFRDACVLAWAHRVLPGLTKQMLAAMADLHPSHVSDYFHPSATHAKGSGRRSLPADKIADVERVLGNRAISQYLAHRAGLTIMEEVIASKVP